MTRTIDNVHWHSARRCSGGACVEVAHGNDSFYVRDSKDPHGPVLAFTIDQARAFLAAVRQGTIR